MTGKTLLPLLIVAFATLIPAANAQTAGSGDFGNYSYRTGTDQPIHDNSAYFGGEQLEMGWAENSNPANNMGYRAPSRRTRTTNTRQYTAMLQGPAGGTLATGTALLAPAPGTIGAPSYSLGFPDGTPGQYTGAYAGGASGGFLPPTATSSVDINIVDGLGGAHTFQGGGSGGSGGSGGGSSGGSQIPPDLPPGWAGVMCHGVYAGAIPPGGNIQAFWRGEYGFAGDAAQQAALLQEGQWLQQNGQI